MKNKNLKKMLSKMQEGKIEISNDFENLSNSLLDKVQGGKDAPQQVNYISCNASGCKTLDL